MKNILNTEEVIHLMTLAIPKGMKTYSFNSSFSWRRNFDEKLLLCNCRGMKKRQLFEVTLHAE